MLSAVLAGILLGAAGVLWAADELQLFYAWYGDDSGLTVQTPSLGISKQLSEANQLGARYTYERFAKAAPDTAVDAVSGATTVAGGVGGGFSQIRREWQLSDAHNFGATQLSGGMVYSDEEDFASRGASLALAQGLLRNNLTLTGMVSATSDTINDAGAGLSRQKDVNALTLAATQVVNPTLVLVGGYSYARVTGYQSQPLRKIVIDEAVPGGLISHTYDENHPQLRLRNTLFLRAKQYLPTGTSLDANLSYYNDDWGVRAYGADLKALHYLRSHLIVRGRWRYYRQGAADFYRQAYTAPAQFMTADTRLRQFDTLLSGVKLIYDWQRGWLPAGSASLDYDRYRETNQGLQADIVMLNCKFPF